MLKHQKPTSPPHTMNRTSDLFELCDQFNHLERKWQELLNLDDHAFYDGLLREQEQLATAISAITPTTVQEYQAIARAIFGWTPTTQADEIGELTGRDAHLITFFLRTLMEETPPEQREAGSL